MSFCQKYSKHFLMNYYFVILLSFFLPIYAKFNFKFMFYTNTCTNFICLN